MLLMNHGDSGTSRSTFKDVQLDVKFVIMKTQINVLFGRDLKQTGLKVISLVMGGMLYLDLVKYPLVLESDYSVVSTYGEEVPTSKRPLLTYLHTIKSEFRFNSGR